MPRAKCVIREGSILVVVIETIQFEVEMSDVDILPSVAVHVGSIDAHAGFVASIFTGRHSGNQRDVFKSSVVLVDEQKVWPRVVGDGDVGPAVIVEIRENHAHAFGLGLSHSGGVAHVGESSVVIVVVELDALAFVVAGMAVGTVARAALAAPDIIFRSPLDVVGDDQIEPAVFVVIEPSRAGGPSAFIGDAGFRRDVGKRAVAVVVIENGAAIAGHIQIGIAVIVEVADGNALAVMAFTADAGFLGDIGESSVAVVVVERATQRMRRFVDVSRGGLDEE